jgi:NhaA family Na+:H+ antiporter
VGLLAGIGFTMSIFITMLAYTNIIYINTGKMAILTASAIAAILGLGVLRVVLRKN